MSVLGIQSSMQMQHNQTLYLSFSSSLSHSPPFFFKPSSMNNIHTTTRISCSISNVHSDGTVDSEREPFPCWKDVYRRIATNRNPQLGTIDVINEWETKRRTLVKWELSRTAKEFRKFKKFKTALEIYDILNNRPEFRMSASDAAVQLDLIAKVRGVSRAEAFFLSLEDKLKDMKTYGALLNAYVHGRLKEKAESLLDTMMRKGYVIDTLTFNVMMGLYMNLKEYDKVDMLVNEMMQKNIELDIYTYNIWLSSSGSRRSIKNMELVFEQLEKDSSIVPNLSTFSIMASMYLRMGRIEKAEECLRKVEGRINGQDRTSFHFLLTLYGSVGKKDEVYRVWNTYKSIFAHIPNLGYRAIICSLFKLDDMEGAEKLSEEWISVKSSYDPRIGNLILGLYLKKGYTDKVLSFFEQMKKGGFVPNSDTWEILSECHIADKKISEALSCLKEAFMAASGSKSWRPNLKNLSRFLELCQEQGDMESAEILIEMLRQPKFRQSRVYAALVGSSCGVKGEGGEKKKKKWRRE